MRVDWTELFGWLLIAAIVCGAALALTGSNPRSFLPHWSSVPPASIVAPADPSTPKH